MAQLNVNALNSTLATLQDKTTEAYINTDKVYHHACMADVDSLAGSMLHVGNPTPVACNFPQFQLVQVRVKHDRS